MFFVQIKGGDGCLCYTIKHSHNGAISMNYL